jgi:rhodanese-related sulfurtransferase
MKTNNAKSQRRRPGPTNTVWIGALAIIMVLSIVMVKHSTMAETHAPATISARQLHQRLASGDKFMLIDVREPREYNAGHIHGAELIPLGKIKSGDFSLDKNADIVLYCRTGHRSGIAASILDSLGFTNVRHLAGGVTKWNYGLTIDKDSKQGEGGQETKPKEVFQ